MSSCPLIVVVSPFASFAPQERTASVNFSMSCVLRRR
jgi:hypothetical protein